MAGIVRKGINQHGETVTGMNSKGQSLHPTKYRELVATGRTTTEPSVPKAETTPAASGAERPGFLEPLLHKQHLESASERSR